MNFLYKLSLACGLAPQCTGILVFLFWLLTRANWLPKAGLVVLYVGLGLFVIGVFCLAIYFIHSRNNNITGYWKRSKVSLVILLANFPVYTGIVTAVIYVASTNLVIIENHSDTIIEELTLLEPSHDYVIGSVLPNKSIKKYYHFQSEGAVHYSFIRNKNKHEGILFAYVSGGMGGTARMVITEQGKVVIEEKT